jgi:predicted O-linked N-acetylglucosamine transferase (SPINDLY family)
MAERDALLAEATEHHLAGRRLEAEAACRTVLAREADNAEALHLLGLLVLESGDAAAGRDLLVRAVAKQPWKSTLHSDLGLAYRALGEADSAIACFSKAQKLQPTLVAAHNNLGMALKARGDLAGAAACYRKALGLAPGIAELHNNLGNLLDQQGHLGDAIDCFERALALKPDGASTHHNLANSLLRQGRVPEAVARFRAALDLDPNLAAAGTNLLMALQYDAGADAALLHREACAWAARNSPPVPPASFEIGTSEAALRVGFVCGDFREHPTAYFFASLLEALADTGLHAVCYANQAEEDAMSRQLMAHAKGWRRIAGMDAARAAQLVRRDRIDILVDLSGHTKDNRLDLFALGAAPMQMGWYAYPGTTGLARMDHVIADARVLPPKEERFFSETPLRLPDCYLCFTPPDAPLTPGPPPMREAGFLRFGSFNNPAKLSGPCIALWARLLHAVPESRLVLRFRFLADPPTAQRLQQAFAAHGIGPERLDLAHAPSRAAALAAYRGIDIALDPFPYNGTTTSCEALWMGVPLVSLRGSRFAARVGDSLLAALGLDELVAEDEARYIAIAAALAADAERLAALRHALRPRLLASPLCDAPRFARNLEAAFRQAWRTRWAS